MKKLGKLQLIALFAVIAILLAELLLGIIYDCRNRSIEPMDARDYPYLYFLYNESQVRNRHGFKTSYPIKKQQGRFRIVFTGGSVAMGKAPEESIQHYLEEILNKRFNTGRIEVVNAGVSAFVVEQVFLNIQLILQHYEPDLIVSLDGYNDLMTFRLNRQHPSGFELPPHYWQDFKVIEYNKEKKTFLSRFKYFFRNISGAMRYFERKKFEKNYNWAALEEDSLKPYSACYWQIVDDTRDFCRAKGILYYNFLQPVKSYDKNAAQNSDDLRAMSRLYRQFEDGIRGRKHAYSLTSVFNERPDIFTDDCHVTPEGNQMLAREIAERISDEVEACLEN